MQTEILKLYERTFTEAFTHGRQIPNEVTRAYLEHKDRQALLGHWRITVIGTWLIAVAYLVLSALGCAHPRGVSSGITRSFGDQSRAAVEIHTACTAPTHGKLQRGSGVLLDASTVLTAAHVIECTDKGEHIDPEAKATVAIDLVDGEHRLTVIAEIDHRHDLARLHIIEPVDLYIAGPPVIAEPRVGDRLCMVTAVPERRWQCSDIIEVKSRTDNQGEIRHNGEVHYGNSGAANYDRLGRLIGITTRLIPCVASDYYVANPATCGGRLSKIYGRPVAGRW